MKYLFLGYLFMLSIVDIRTKRLPTLWIYAGLIGMTCYGLLQLVTGRRSFLDLVCALLPGTACFLLARVSKVVGEGDAWLLIEIGLGFEVMTLIRMIMFSFWMAALSAVMVFIIKGKIKNHNMPFVPYLFLATVFVVTGFGKG